MQLTKRNIEHPEWGAIVITVNPRARRMIMRARPGAIYMTISPLATERDIESALSKFGNKLKQLQLKGERNITPGYSIGAGRYSICIDKYKGWEFMWIHDTGRATLMCPEETSFEARQDWLRKAITNEITAEAKRTLPERLNRLAGQHNLKYSSCSVRNTHSRWGSCSGKGNISLSIYLVLLPEELIDYVLLHELCHTIEMNHSKRFWALLDRICGCSSQNLRKELKKYNTSI